MTNSIVDTLNWLQLKRVAHFTPSKNLFHIIQDGQIRSSKDLADRASEYFAPTDLERFDRHPDKTCVSFTYRTGTTSVALARSRNTPVFQTGCVCSFRFVCLSVRESCSPLAMLRRGGEVRTRRRGGLRRCRLVSAVRPHRDSRAGNATTTCGYRSSGRSADTRSYSVVRPNRDRRSVS